MISVDENVYNQIKRWAETDNRSIGKEVKFMVDSILNRRLVFMDHVTGQQPVIQSQPAQPALDELDRLYEEAMKKPKPVLNGGLLTSEEIEKYSGQNIIVDDD